MQDLKCSISSAIVQVSEYEATTHAELCLVSALWYFDAHRLWEIMEGYAMQPTSDMAPKQTSTVTSSIRRGASIKIQKDCIGFAQSAGRNLDE